MSAALVQTSHRMTTRAALCGSIEKANRKAVQIAPLQRAAFLWVNGKGKGNPSDPRRLIFFVPLLIVG